MLKLISFLCLLYYAIEAVPPSKVPQLDSRIVGGYNTTITSYPHQVSVQYNGSHVCGGSVISANWVLTSARCMVNSIAYYTICAGSSNYKCSGTTHRVSIVTPHPQFNSGTYDYDVAVIRVTDAFTFSSNVRPVGLAKTTPPSGRTAIATGWGYTTQGGSFPSTLQYVELLTMSAEVCREFYPKSSITERMICAGYVVGERGACDGDVGGPLVVNGEQVGITSWGLGCAQPLYPPVYTDVANLRSWISETAGLNSATLRSAFTFTILSAFLFTLWTFYN